MITLNNKPKSYVPFDNLTICSNTLTGGSNLVAVGDFLPLLIGQGEVPQVWLLALADANRNLFVPVVEANISKHHAVKVFEEDGCINVVVGDDNVLKVKKKTNEHAVVTEIDLRPIGLNIHGTEEKLWAGNGSFKNSGFGGGGTFIGFGAPNSNK